MVLCETMNSIRSRPRPSLHDIYNTAVNNVIHMDIPNQIQLVQGLARSLSVGVINIPNNLFTQQSFLEQVNKKDLSFTSNENELDFKAIIEENSKRHYSTKTPYKYPSKEYILSSPPTGYKPISIQLLARHGSRTLNDNNYDVEILKIWKLAKQNNMLTSLGEQLEGDIKLFMDANNRIGRGELTNLGKEEHFGIGNRLYQRLKNLFIPSNTISVVTSGKKRAMDSAQEFVNGIKNLQYNLQIKHEKANKNILYFHKLSKNYMTFKNTNQHIKIKMNSIKNLQQTKFYAKEILKRIFKEEFIKLLINKNNNIESNKEFKQNEIDFILSLYSLFSVAPAQNHLYLTKMLAKYFTEQESHWFSYIHDAQEFYLKGPSIEGSTITYDMAKPLLKDFFSSINTCIKSNNTTSARLRFAHAETIIPFATLLEIPDLSDKPVDFFDIYTYENNQWRGDKISPMAANIQWEVYQHEHDHNQVLIRMLYNEMEVRFKKDCQSITSESFFYDFNELKRAYANHLLS